LSYAVQFCSAAIENLLLAAHALGLGACWLGVHPREDKIRRVKEILGLPAQLCLCRASPSAILVRRKSPAPDSTRLYVHWEKW